MPDPIHVDRCHGHSKSGKPCGHPAGWGTDHLGFGLCKFHAGNTPNGRASAQVQAARQAVAKLAITSADIAEDIDPRDALAIELYRTSRAVEVIGEKLNQLGWDASDRDATDAEAARRVNRSIVTELTHHTGGKTGETVPHALWKMWHAERQHYVRVAAECAKAGVQARRIALAEQTAQLVAQLFRSVAADPELALEPATQTLLLSVAARHMRSLPE